MESCRIRCLWGNTDEWVRWYSYFCPPPWWTGMSEIDLYSRINGELCMLAHLLTIWIIELNLIIRIQYGAVSISCLRHLDRRLFTGVFIDKPQLISISNNHVCSSTAPALLYPINDSWPIKCLSNESWTWVSRYNFEIGKRISFLFGGIPSVLKGFLNSLNTYKVTISKSISCFRINQIGDIRKYVSVRGILVSFSRILWFLILWYS